MPSYVFCCHSCSYRYDDFLPFSAKLPTKCPRCKSTDFGQDYSQNNPVGLVKGNPTTFGQQSEINAKRLGKEQMEMLAASDKSRVSHFKGKLPKGASINTIGTGEAPWRDGKPIDPTKIENFEKFMETGQTNARTRRKRER